MAEECYFRVDSGDMFCCKVCYEKYNDADRLPKLLPCAHTYCLACHKGWAEKNIKKGFISCPSCKREHKLPVDGVDKLNTNFALMEAIDEASKNKQAVPSNTKESTIATDEGNAQQRSVVGAVGSSQHETQHLLSTLRALAIQVHKSGKVFDDIITAVRGERHDVTVKREATVKTIASEYNEILKTAAKWKDYLLQEVNKCCEQNLTLLTAYEDEYNRKKEQHDNYYKEMLKEIDVQQQDKKPSHEVLDRLCQDAQSRSLNLNHEFQITSKELRYSSDSFKGIVDDIKSCGKVSLISHNITIQPTCPVQQTGPATTGIHSDSLNRYQLKSRVVRTYDANSPCCVTQLSNEEIAIANANSYNISIFWSPEHKRTIRVKLSQAVTFNQGITGMCMGPDDTLLISNPDQNEIQRLDLLGNIIKIIRVSKKEEFDPAGMVCSPSGRLYVCDRKNHLVRVFALSQNGWEEITRIGKRGKDPGHFNNPSDVALMPEGEIAVADFKNDRIQIFDGKTFVFKRMIATSGSELGQLKGPSGISVDSEGFMAITEPLNHRVQLFTPGGKPFMTLGAAEEGPGYLKWPIGIAITLAKEVVVCDRGNDKVLVF